MARVERGRRARRRARQVMAALILLLLPLLALGGALMPSMIEITPDEEAATGAPPPPPYESPDIERRPLLIPRDYSVGFVPELINEQELFIAGAPNLRERFAALPSFPASQGDLIILDDIEQFVRRIFFEDPLETGLGYDARGGPFDDSIFSMLPDPFGAEPGLQYDDFAGGSSPAVVPEPSTVLLLGLGLLGMARRRPTT